MGLPPTGEIVARPMVKRACGHLCEFQHYAVDKYRSQRLAKFQGSRCPECVAVLVEEQRRASLPKGEAFKQLPQGTQISMALRPDGGWSGSLVGGGITVRHDAHSDAGPAAVLLALARQWVNQHDEKAGTA